MPIFTLALESGGVNSVRVLCMAAILGLQVLSLYLLSPRCKSPKNNSDKAREAWKKMCAQRAVDFPPCSLHLSLQLV